MFVGYFVHIHTIASHEINRLTISNIPLISCILLKQRVRLCFFALIFFQIRKILETECDNYFREFWDRKYKCDIIYVIK